jgi:hypothetical protein
MTDSSTLERLIGHSLPAAERESIGNLNKLPENLIEEARNLRSPLIAVAFLAYFTDARSVSYLNNFVEDVVFGETPAESWRRGGTLVPGWSLAEQLTLPFESLLAPIGGYSGWRTSPRPDRWRDDTPWTGAPARPRPAATYLTGAPPHAVNLADAAVETAGDGTIAVRRWIACSLAGALRPGTPKSLNDLLALAPETNPRGQWSDDARIAAMALIHEFQEFGMPQPNRDIPGFRGPDIWYSMT